MNIYTHVFKEKDKKGTRKELEEGTPKGAGGRKWKGKLIYLYFN